MADLLDDPRIEPLRRRIHDARGHDWEPPCGGCFDEAYHYIRTADVLGALTASRERERRLREALNSSARFVHAKGYTDSAHVRYDGRGVHDEARYVLIPFEECPDADCVAARAALLDTESLE